MISLSFALPTVWCYIGYLRQHKHYKNKTAPVKVTNVGTYSCSDQLQNIAVTFLFTLGNFY